MKKVVCLLPVKDRHKELLEKQTDAEFVYRKGKTVTAEDVRDADAIVGNIRPELLQHCRNLKLLQLNSAGTDGYTAPGVLPEGCKLANATGAYGLAISEHLLAMLLALQKKILTYHLQQQNGEWIDQGTVTSIYGSTTLVIGLGDIGGEFASRMRALGSHVIGIRRTAGEKPDYVDEIDTTDHLEQYLPQADIIAMSLPGTPATYHIINEKTLSLMKPTAILLNVGRGTAIDQDALAYALNNDRLGGCGVDVTDPEPLPQDHPLWHAKNMLITPHISGQFHLPETFERIVRIAAQNLRAVENGLPIRNEVDFTTGYRKR